MIPLKDDIPSESFPFVTIGLIGLNVLVFLYQASIGMGGDPRAAEAVVFEFGATPCRLTGACSVPGEFPSPVTTIFTSMFLHGGLLHVAGNMLYLWIFGDNVEDTLGHGRYLALYLLAGADRARLLDRHPVPERDPDIQLDGMGRGRGRWNGLVCPHRGLPGGHGPAVSDADSASRSPIMSAS